MSKIYALLGDCCKWRNNQQPGNEEVCNAPHVNEKISNWRAEWKRPGCDPILLNRRVLFTRLIGFARLISQDLRAR